MRTLKFRVWDKSKKQFLDPKDYVGELLLDFQGQIRLAQFPCGDGDNAADSVFDVYKTDDLVIQQFTGFKDSRGQEIYEGDLCYYKGYESPMGYEPAHCHVVWDENGYFADCFSFHWVLNAKFCAESLTVVGNKFEGRRMV